MHAAALAALALVVGARAVAIASDDAPLDGPAPALQVEVDPCVSVDRAAIDRIVELEQSLVEANGGGPPVVAHVDCAGEELRLNVAAVGRPAVERRVPIGAYPAGARARVLALALVELAAAARRPDAAASVTTVAPPPPPRAPMAAPPSRSVLLLAGTGAELTPSDVVTLVVPTVALELRPSRHLGGRLALEATTTEQGTPYGRVAYGRAALAAALLWQVGFDHWRFAMGGGARAGLVRLRGEPDARVVGHGATRATWGPLALASLTFVAARRWCVQLGIEAGLHARSVQAVAEQVQVLEQSGGWIKPSIAIGYAF